MTILESFPVALFIAFMVFVLLGVIYLLISLSSYAIRMVDSRNKKNVVQIPEETNKIVESETEEEEFSSGTLKLKNVDETTAAMIISIVSHESGIPLTELCFKSIKLIEAKEN